MAPVSLNSQAVLSFNAFSEMAASIVQLTFHTVATTTGNRSSDAIPCDTPNNIAMDLIALKATLGKGVLYPSTLL